MYKVISHNEYDASVAAYDEFIKAAEEFAEACDKYIAVCKESDTKRDLDDMRTIIKAKALAQKI